MTEDRRPTGLTSSKSHRPDHAAHIAMLRMVILSRKDLAASASHFMAGSMASRVEPDERSVSAFMRSPFSKLAPLRLSHPIAICPPVRASVMREFEMQGLPRRPGGSGWSAIREIVTRSGWEGEVPGVQVR